MKTIPLTKGKVAIIDDDDFDSIARFKWRFFKGYATRDEWHHGRRTFFAMHRVIAKTPKGFQTDHENGNGLDNRKINLRHCSASENRQNQKVRTSNRFGLKGVTFKSSSGKFMARIGIPGAKKSKHLGYYKTAIEAHAAYCRAAEIEYGSFARFA